MRSMVVVSCLVAWAGPLAARQWLVPPIGTGAEFRGIHAVSDRVVWAAGRGGVIAHTVNGGRTWTVDTIPGATGLFLVGVHAEDAHRAWALGTAFAGSSLARIYHTADAGQTWETQYENAEKGVFFDGLAFWDARHGIAFSDPIAGGLLVVTTEDGGGHWTPIPPGRIPATLPGEAAFAASGTAITVRGKGDVWIATGGGPRARVFHSSDRGTSWEVFETPGSGGSGKGLFGIALDERRHAVAVGGDYQKREDSLENLLLSEDGGRTWRVATAPGLTGVQYGLAYAGEKRFLSVGPTGSALTVDDGKTWLRLDGPGFNTVSCAALSRVCWAAGVDGRVGRYDGRAVGRSD